eukprot:361446-Chlamydomonas_euryale.AAC.1
MEEPSTWKSHAHGRAKCMEEPNAWKSQQVEPRIPALLAVQGWTARSGAVRACACWRVPHHAGSAPRSYRPHPTLTSCSVSATARRPDSCSYCVLAARNMRCLARRFGPARQQKCEKCGAQGHALWGTNSPAALDSATVLDGPAALDSPAALESAAVLDSPAALDSPVARLQHAPVGKSSRNCSSVALHSVRTAGACDLTNSSCTHSMASYTSGT